MLNRDDSQQVNAASGSTAIQAGGDLVINNGGLTYTEARQVALDVFRANFLELAGEAKQAAIERAEEMTDNFLKKLQSEHPAGIAQAGTADLQYGLFEAQKQFARSPDSNLGDLLVDLLVDRIKHPSRDMLQIVLNESLSVAPKLTGEQIDLLSVVFFFKYVNTQGRLLLAQVGDDLDKFVAPFLNGIRLTDISLQHIQFAGCGSTQVMSASLEDILFQRYQGFLVRGFEPTFLNGCSFLFGQTGQSLLAPSTYDGSKNIVRAQNGADLEAKLSAHRVSASDADRLRAAFAQNRLSAEEIKEKFIALRPYMKDLFEAWSATAINNFMLTSVGICIGHANIKKRIGEFANLEIWVK